MGTIQPPYSKSKAVALILTVMMVGITVASWGNIIKHPHTLPANIFAHNISLSEYTLEEAVELMQEKLPTSIDLLLADEEGNALFSFPLALADINGSYDWEYFYHRIWNLLNPSFTEFLALNLSLFPARVDINVPLTYDQNLLVQWSENVILQLPKVAADAFVEVVEGKPVAHPHVYGYNISLEDIVANTQESLANNLLSQPKVMLSLDRPAVYLEDLPDFSNNISSFSTKVSTNRNRTENVILASQLINGQVVEPGQTFSFIETVGKATAERGFKPATVIFQQQAITGIGGGICQVSSTLYQAVLRAKLPVVERRNHSLPLNYLPIGFDATVSYGNVDFRFSNPFSYPLIITSYMEKDNLWVNIFGPEQHEIPSVEIVARNIQIIPPPTRTILDSELPKGMELIENKGSNGYRVSIYRLTYDNGEVLEEEHISRDTYTPVPRVVRVGTGDTITKK